MFTCFNLFRKTHRSFFCGIFFIAALCWACEEDECDGSDPAKFTCSEDYECTMECDCDDGQTFNFGSCNKVCGDNGTCNSTGVCMSASDACNQACGSINAKWKGSACYIGTHSNNSEQSSQSKVPEDKSDASETTDSSAEEIEENKADSGIQLQPH